MVDKETIETKVVDSKEKVENKFEEEKDRIKSKAKENHDRKEEKKEKVKETITNTKDKSKAKAEKTKEKSKELKDNVEKDLSEGIDSFRENVKNIQTIIDEKINEYKNVAVQNLNTEVLEDEENYYIRVSVPGINKEDIEITANETEVIIEATFKPLSEKIEDATVLLNEMKVGKCNKSINFDNPIDMEKIKAKYNNGIIDLTIPKIVKPNQKVTIE